MKAKEIQALKEMSREIVDSFPENLTLDGLGNLYVQGERRDIYVLMTQVSTTNTKIRELNDVIQSIKGRDIKPS